MINKEEATRETLSRVSNRMVSRAYANQGIKNLNTEDKSRHINSIIKIGSYDCGSTAYASVWDEIPIEEIYNNSLNSPTIGEINVFRSKTHMFYSICCPKTDFVDKFKQLTMHVDYILESKPNLKSASQLDVVEVRIDEDSQPWLVSIIGLYDPDMYLKVRIESAYDESISSVYYEDRKPIWEELVNE